MFGVTLSRAYPHCNCIELKPLGKPEILDCRQRVLVLAALSAQRFELKSEVMEFMCSMLLEKSFAEFGDAAQVMSSRNAPKKDQTISRLSRGFL